MQEIDWEKLYKKAAIGPGSNQRVLGVTYAHTMWKKCQEEGAQFAQTEKSVKSNMALAKGCFSGIPSEAGV